MASLSQRRREDGGHWQRVGRTQSVLHDSMEMGEYHLEGGEREREREERERERERERDNSTVFIDRAMFLEIVNIYRLGQSISTPHLLTQSPTTL